MEIHLCAQSVSLTAVAYLCGRQICGTLEIFAKELIPLKYTEHRRSVVDVVPGMTVLDYGLISY